MSISGEVFKGEALSRVPVKGTLATLGKMKMVKHKLLVNRSILERGSFANPIPDLGYHFIA